MVAAEVTTDIKSILDGNIGKILVAEGYRMSVDVVL
jgi:hypothetical protein